MTSATRFVTDAEFREVLKIVEAHPTDGRRSPFKSWFSLVLRALYATGCRPAEVVGTRGRSSLDPTRPGLSQVKAHHGLRPRDILPNYRIYVEGKHTNPRRKTKALKPRVVLCADKQVWFELRSLANTRPPDSEANIFFPTTRDGKELLRDEIEKLQRRLPPQFSGFSPRWLRHSHAINAIRNGIDLVSIQRQLGHEHLSTTAIYLRYAGLDDSRYLNAFGGTLGPDLESRDCPSCGFEWSVDRRTGALDLGSRMGVAMRRRVVA